jgi:hypothetical protein
VSCLCLYDLIPLCSIPLPFRYKGSNTIRNISSYRKHSIAYRVPGRAARRGDSAVWPSTVLAKLSGIAAAQWV